MDDLSMTELTEAVSDSETDCYTGTVSDLSDGSSHQLILILLYFKRYLVEPKFYITRNTERNFSNITQLYPCPPSLFPIPMSITI